MDFNIRGEISVEHLRMQLDFKKSLIELTKVEIKAIEETIAAIQATKNGDVIKLTAEGI